MTRVDHTGIYVKDIQWHISFFTQALGMKVTDTDQENGIVRQVWLDGGIQLIADPDFNGPEGRHGHIGIQVDDPEKAIVAAYSWGAKELPKGRNWVQLPDGLWIEILID